MEQALEEVKKRQMIDELPAEEAEKMKRRQARAQGVRPRKNKDKSHGWNSSLGWISLEDVEVGWRYKAKPVARSSKRGTSSEVSSLTLRVWCL